MAGNHSKNEVAAKMIGAQLQSLLKIPPINKADAQKGTGTAPEETRDSGKGNCTLSLSESLSLIKNNECSINYFLFIRTWEIHGRKGK